MTANQFRLAAFLLIIGAIALVSAVDRDPSARAQTPASPAAAPVGRFQISAYGTPSSEGLNPGCYIVDTTNGKVWHTRLGAGMVEVAKQPLLGAP